MLATAPRSRPSADHLGRQLRCDRSVSEAGPAGTFHKQGPVAGYDRSHQPELLVEGADISRRSGRHQHHLHPGLTHVGDGALGPLGDVPRTREEGTVEVDEDQPHHAAGAHQLGQPARDVVQVLAHGLPGLLLRHPSGWPA